MLLSGSPLLFCSCWLCSLRQWLCVSKKCVYVWFALSRCFTQTVCKLLNAFSIIKALLDHCPRLHYKLLAWSKQIVEIECAERSWVVRSGFDISVCLSFQVIWQSPHSLHLYHSLFLSLSLQSLRHRLSLSSSLSLSVPPCQYINREKWQQVLPLLKGFSDHSAPGLIFYFSPLQFCSEKKKLPHNIS